MKKILFFACIMCALGIIPVFAVQTLGRVSAKASFDYDLDDSDMSCIFYGWGTGDELYVQEDDVKNFHVKAVVLSEDNTLVTSNEATKYNVIRVSTTCGKEVSDVLDYGTKFHTEAYARAIYSNGSISEEIEMTIPVKIAEMLKNTKTQDFEMFEEEGYTFIPREDFWGKDTKLYLKEKNDLKDKVSFIYGDHFMQGQEGDKIPTGVYIANDKKSCYVIDRKADGSIIKTVYDLTVNTYEKVSSTRIGKNMLILKNYIKNGMIFFHIQIFLGVL